MALFHFMQSIFHLGATSDAIKAGLRLGLDCRGDDLQGSILVALPIALSLARAVQVGPNRNIRRPPWPD
jgi:hypothetical protein